MSVYALSDFSVLFPYFMKRALFNSSIITHFLYYNIQHKAYISQALSALSAKLNTLILATHGAEKAWILTKYVVYCSNHYTEMLAKLLLSTY